MARKLILIKPVPVDVLDYTTELSDWVEAISTFQTYYVHLSSCTIEEPFQQGKHQQKNRQHGQCPMDQLKLLLSAMQTELEALIKDMDQADLSRLPNTRESRNKLALHTRRLNLLNQRAQTMMQLTMLSTS